ncbi:unnamed protein product [Chilo suppressalis]|uniref:WW domain-containing protein n=1 Tax=Chilo suppressalis TaxID=168631 RepID=A0ABN8BAX3_CHISP|nr:unnamed protein product [Chilo suppressalis]
MCPSVLMIGKFGLSELPNLHPLHLRPVRGRAGGAVRVRVGREPCARGAGGACVSRATSAIQKNVGWRRANPSRASVVSQRWARSVSGLLRADTTMALNSDSEQKSNLVLRVDQDSDSVLQSLFDTVLKPDSKRPLQVPLRMRQLPKSFFNPPSTGSKSPSVSHSRENSADSAFGSVSATGATPVSHSRAHSSPASLQQTYAAGQQSQQQPIHHQHAKHRSYDVGSHLNDDLGPLPAGWEQARTPEGQIYYLNSVNSKKEMVEVIKTSTYHGVCDNIHTRTNVLLSPSEKSVTVGRREPRQSVGGGASCPLCLRLILAQAPRRQPPLLLARSPHPIEHGTHAVYFGMALAQATCQRRPFCSINLSKA